MSGNFRSSASCLREQFQSEKAGWLKALTSHGSFLVDLSSAVIEDNHVFMISSFYTLLMKFLIKIRILIKVTAKKCISEGFKQISSNLLIYKLESTAFRSWISLEYQHSKLLFYYKLSSLADGPCTSVLLLWNVLNTWLQDFYLEETNDCIEGWK